MSIISFQPAFDPLHTIFRVLRLWPILKGAGPLHRDAVRILDFFLLFPFRIDRIRMLPQHRKHKKLSSEYEWAKPYGEQPENRTLFDRMEPVQAAALGTLASRGLLDPQRFTRNEVVVTDQVVPSELLERIQACNERDSSLLDFLDALATEYELTGPNGLKARTDLLEYRYDPV